MSGRSDLPPQLDAALRQLGVVPRKGAAPSPQPPIDWTFKAVVGEPDF